MTACAIGMPFNHQLLKYSYYEEEFCWIKCFFFIVYLLFSVIMATAFKLRSQQMGLGNGNTEALGTTVHHK